MHDGIAYGHDVITKFPELHGLLPFSLTNGCSASGLRPLELRYYSTLLQNDLICINLILTSKSKAKKYLHVYIFFYEASCCHPYHHDVESSRLKRMASKLQKNPRRINKEMACKMYEQTGVIVAIGSGNNTSTHSLRSIYLLESIKTRNRRKVQRLLVGYSQGFVTNQ